MNFIRSFFYLTPEVPIYPFRLIDSTLVSTTPMASVSIAKSGTTVNGLHPRLQHLPQFTSISLTPAIKDIRSYPPSLAVRTTHGSSFPVIRAQISEEDYIPHSKFYKIEAILRPWRIQQVSSSLLKMGIRGVTISDVRGFGAQGGSTERQAGSEFSEDNFVAKVKIEIVVTKDQVEAVIEKIIDEARTGEIGDGKIFLIPVSDVIRVRTGERGEMAERMTGGRSDMTFTTGSST